MQNVKKIIPNILTLSRILVTPLIIYMGLNNHLLSLVFIVVIIALTDFLDGKLARLWNTTSELGAKLDAIGDKVLAISLLLILIMKNKLFIYILVLEVAISLLNLYTYIRTKKSMSILTGKIKTWVIFITIVIGLLNIVFSNLNTFLDLCIIITIIFQIVAFIKYIFVYIDLKTGKKKD